MAGLATVCYAVGMMEFVPYPETFKPCGAVVAVGNFDGVHAGHRALLAAGRAWADEMGVPLVALTFWPHPRAVLFPDKPFKLLMTLEERVAALKDAGAEAVAVLGFDGHVAGMGEAEFRQRILVDWLGAVGIIVGENFRYGHKAAGDVAALASDKKFATRAVPLLRDGGGEIVSSSRLR